VTTAVCGEVLACPAMSTFPARSVFSGNSRNVLARVAITPRARWRRFRSRRAGCQVPKN